MLRKTVRTLITAVLLACAAPAFTHGAADSAQYVTERITVTGAVENTLTLDVDALRRFPPQQVGEVPLVCQSGANVGRLENYRGVRLGDILERAVIRAPAHNDVKKMVVIAGASDGYKVVFSWSEVFNTPVGEGIMVLFEKDGMPLGNEDGRIALVSTRDLRTGARRVKWLQSIEVRRVVE
jgi:DMSO/TMAO reductase YedYZ molybdopterin-dependent catalytic subunit